VADLASDLDVIVIGAGLVGLACAEALAESGRSVVIVEKGARIAGETSARNSGVVHAGLYYPDGSLKAQLCIRGRMLLTDRTARGRIAVRPLGKLIVAVNDDELSHLSSLERNARACGVELEPLDAAAARRLEPALRVRAALLSPKTGIVDITELASDYLRGALKADATLLPKSTVVALETKAGRGWRVRIRHRDGSEVDAFSRWVINAAGLDADGVARLAGIDVDRLALRQYACKGSYFEVRGPLAKAVRRLIYPLPSGPGLGIHLTQGTDGTLRAGPDAEYVDERDLTVDEAKAETFAQSVARYLPGLSAEHLVPAYAGLRPKLAAPGQPARDFVIRHEAALGLPGLVNLLGIESPGLTASPAIAERVSAIVSEADA